MEPSSMNMTPPATPIESTLSQDLQQWSGDENWEFSENFDQEPVSPVLSSKRKSGKAKIPNTPKTYSSKCINFSAETEVNNDQCPHYNDDNWILQRTLNFWNSKPATLTPDDIFFEGGDICMNETYTCENLSELFMEALLHMQIIKDSSHKYSGTFFNKSLHFLTSKDCAANFEAISRILNFSLNTIKGLASEENPPNIDIIMNIAQNLLMLSNASQAMLDDCLRIHFGFENHTEMPLDCVHVYCLVNAHLLMLHAHLNKIPSLKSQMEVFDLMYYNGCSVASESSFLQMLINRTIAECFFVASSKYEHLLNNSKFTSNKDRENFCHKILQNNKPFLCKCHEQLFVLSIHVLDYVNSEMNWHNNVEKPIWDIITSQTNFILHSTQQEQNKDYKKCLNDSTFGTLPSFADAVSFSWWTTSYFLHSFSSKLNPKSETVQFSSCSGLVTRLLRYSTNLSSNNTSAMIYHLSCYHKILSYWNECEYSFSSSDLAPFIMLWMFVSRNLNHLEVVASVFKQNTFGKRTANEWIEKLSQHLTLCENVGENKSSSFDIFLSILSSFLHGKRFSTTWPILKVRFFNVLKPNLLRELNEHGLEKLFSTFMIFIIKCDNLCLISKDIFKSLLNCLDNVTIGTADYQKQTIVVTGLFSVIQLASNENCNFASLAVKIGKIFKKVSKLFAARSGSLEHRKQLWEVICSYLKNATTIITATQKYNLGQENLFPECCFSLALREVKSSESAIVLEHVTHILSCLRDHLKTTTDENTVNIFSNIVFEILDWLKNLCKSQSALVDDISKLCYNITTCLQLLPNHEFSRSTDKETTLLNFFDMFECFGCSAEVDVVIRHKFLCLMLKDEKTIKMLNSTSKDLPQNLENLRILEKTKKLNVNIFKSWISCAALAKVYAVEDEHDLGRLLRNLEYVKPNLSLNLSQNTFWGFVQKLSHDYDSCSFMERKQKKDVSIEWFSDYPMVVKKCLDNFYQCSIKPDNIKFLYHVSGRILSLCSKSLNISVGVKSNSNIPLQIVNTLLLKQQSRQKVPVLEDDISNLYSCLHMFLIGLSSLDYAYNTSVQMALKDVLEVYFSRYTARNHPLFHAITASNVTDLQVNVMLLALKDVVGKTTPIEVKAKKQVLVVDILYQWLSSETNQRDITKIPALQKIMYDCNLARIPSFVERTQFIKRLLVKK